MTAVQNKNDWVDKCPKYVPVDLGLKLKCGDNFGLLTKKEL